MPCLPEMILRNKSGRLVALQPCQQIVCTCLPKDLVRRGEILDVCKSWHGWLVKDLPLSCLSLGLCSYVTMFFICATETLSRAPCQ